jgi:FkbM family methyltransferase
MVEYMWRNLKYYDENGNKINHLIKERKEQILCNEFITPDCVVLELGARYGSSSCVANCILANKTNQVSVEPDSRVWAALERNRDLNGCLFHIHKGFVSNKPRVLVNLDSWGGYAASSVVSEASDIQSISLKELEAKYSLKFDTLIADCEGFLETFFDENPDFYKQMKLFIFEKDYPKECNYNKIKQNLIKHNFKQVAGISDTDKSRSLFRECWKKTNL